MIDNDRQYRLVAEAEAWPFVAKIGFDSCTLVLERNEFEDLAPATEQLSLALIERLRTVGRSLSLETIRSVRDLAWFTANGNKAARSVHLDQHLSRLALGYLRSVGDGWELVERSDAQRRDIDGQLAYRVRRFRWLSLMLPLDLLVAAYCARTGVRAGSLRVSIATPVLKASLARGVAETHVHMGGAFDFSLLWTSLMQDITVRIPELKTRGALSSLFGDVRRAQRLLYAAAIARLVLARFLSKPPSNSRELTAAELETHIATMARSSATSADARRTLRIALASLLGKQPIESERRLRFVYAQLTGPRRRARALDDFLTNDPIAALFPPRGGATAEVRLTSAALRYLGECRGRGRIDIGFARLFWQYCRVRVRLFRYLTMEPGMAGLDWFSEAYARISPLRGALDEFQAAAALAHQSKDLALTAIELRTTPERTRSENLRTVKNVAIQTLRRNAGSSCPTEVGLTFHFIKVGRSLRKQLHGDPGSVHLSSRYARWVRDNELRALSIVAAMRARPEILLLVNGVDVAGPELSIPTWPTLIPLRLVRLASERAAALLARRRPEWNVRPLRLTYHAGEDFRRLIEGIRRIDEVREFAPLRSGDRIGHGLALFMPPSKWAERFQWTYQPCDARLDDLLWELDRYRWNDFPAPPGRLPFVEAEAKRLADKIYGAAHALEAFIESRSRRHDPVYLQSIGYPAVPDGRSASPAVLNQYLRDRGAFIRGHESVEIRTEGSEVAMLELAQAWLTKRLSEREVTIETNPSSNQLIADYDCLDDHPVFFDMAKRGQGAVSCSVSSDDPLTFVTHLADEYAYVYFALMRVGCSSRVALARLDELREAGLRSRFTYPASAELASLRSLLDALDPPRERWATRPRGSAARA